MGNISQEAEAVPRPAGGSSAEAIETLFGKQQEGKSWADRVAIKPISQPSAELFSQLIN
jgi:hypothetical protein